jgi:hypothetical protein
MLENYDSVQITGAQLRKIVDLADGLAAPGDEDVSEGITLAERPVFQYDSEVLYLSITCWFGGGGRSRGVEAYLAKDGSEIVRKAEDTT